MQGAVWTKKEGERTFLSFWNSASGRHKGRKSDLFFNSFEMIRWRQPRKTFNYTMRGRKAGRERKETRRNLFYMWDGEEESGKWGLGGGFQAAILRRKHKRQMPRFQTGKQKTQHTWSSPWQPLPHGSGWCLVMQEKISRPSQPAHDLSSWYEPEGGPAGGAGSGAQGHRIKPSLYATCYPLRLGAMT